MPIHWLPLNSCISHHCSLIRRITLPGHFSASQFVCLRLAIYLLCSNRCLTHSFLTLIAFILYAGSARSPPRRGEIEKCCRPGRHSPVIRLNRCKCHSFHLFALYWCWPAKLFNGHHYYFYYYYYTHLDSLIGRTDLSCNLHLYAASCSIGHFIAINWHIASFFQYSLTPSPLFEVCCSPSLFLHDSDYHWACILSSHLQELFFQNLTQAVFSTKLKCAWRGNEWNCWFFISTELLASIYGHPLRNTVCLCRQWRHTAAHQFFSVIN